ncbi:cytochrome P450 724B1-like [Aristolochia californica]|uniref:cytochrome P450 724B1-like n=1 Tax=Aristolochia californica TaxID=171875 RepID=UPI0035D5A7E6
MIPVFLLSLLNLSSLLTALVLLLLSYVFRTYIVTSRNSPSLPPGSFGWFPFLGQTVSFIAPHCSSSRGHFIEQNIRRYGTIFRSHLFGHPTVVSCDPDFNSFVLHNEERLFLSSYPSNIPGILGQLTLLVATGDVHKRLRAVALNLFATMKAQNEFFLSDIENNALRVMRSWKNKERLVFCQETRKFTFSVIVKQILSLGPEDPVTIEILDNFTTFMKGLCSIPLNLPGTAFARAIQAKHRIKAITKTLLHQRRRGEGREGQRKMDFMDVLITHDELSEDEILSLVLDLLLGGYETTSMLIAIVVRFLSDCPKALNELRKEQRKLRSSKMGDEALTWDDYQKMTFTHSLIHEALRCGNVVKFVHRKTIKTIYYKGFEIPSGWKVLPVFTGVHLDPSNHANPLDFNPWRWQEDEKGVGGGGGGKIFTPFGGGKRLCPGSDIAKLEAAIFLHHLVLNYSWVPLMENDWPLSLPYLDFKHGLPLSIRSLSQSDQSHCCNVNARN